MILRARIQPHFHHHRTAFQENITTGENGPAFIWQLCYIVKFCAKISIFPYLLLFIIREWLRKKKKTFSDSRLGRNESRKKCFFYFRNHYSIIVPHSLCSPPGGQTYSKTALFVFGRVLSHFCSFFLFVLRRTFL
jgi:hypothetical protein